MSYRDARFRLRASVKVAADADAAVVLPAIETRLRAAFGFDARSFGQGVSVDEVSAVAHGVAGVVAVHVTELHRTDTPSPALVPRLFAALPVASLTVLPLAAELLDARRRAARPLDLLDMSSFDDRHALPPAAGGPSRPRRRARRVRCGSLRLSRRSPPRSA